MNNGNYQIDYRTLEKKEKNLYTETTIFIVLKGQLVVNTEEASFLRTAGDIFVINANENVELALNFQKQCLFLELKINNLFFASQFPSFFHTKFECLSKQLTHGKMNILASLRKQVAELCLIDFSNESSKTLKQTLALCQIILTLIQYFQKETEQGKLSENIKLREILEYIEEHFQEGVPLLEVAEHFFMSESALSKFFKKETGTYFSTYVGAICVKHSVNELLYSKKSIEQIALNNGFSNSKTYRQRFKKVFGESPVTYRMNHLERTEKSRPEKIEEIDHIPMSKEILMALYEYAQVPLEETQTTDIFSKNKKLQITAEPIGVERKMGQVIVHVGRLEYLSSKRIQDEILELKKTVTIQYVSVDALFDETPLSVGIHQETRLNSFPSFERLELILEFLREVNIALFFHFSLTKYQQLTERVKRIHRDFFRHMQNQFDFNHFTEWKMNCIFDGESCQSTFAEFLNFHELLLAASIPISLGAEIPLGDPFFDENHQKEQQFFYEEIASKCEFLTFTAEPNYIFNETRELFVNLENYHQYVINKVFHIKHKLKEYDLDLPLFLTDWNTLTGITRITNGTFFRGAIILKDILKLDLLVSGYGFWLDMVIYEEYKSQRKMKNDGLELFHYYGSKRPAYFCLQMTRRLQGRIVARGEEYVLTYNHGKYQLLIWNTNYFDPHLSSEETFLESQTVTYDLEICMMKPHRYRVKQIELNRHNGALFYSYEEFRKAETLDLETQNYIAQMTRPKISAFDIEIDDEFHYYTTIDTNGVVLLELTPILY
ncbi:MAG: helix-turn-helix domain-containing protein [Lactobacillales bacterium]|jgi:beta-xylosidase/AraC-like DNA-binding protein|nr:helix-turn-helix domain-containing protein [Lactobacillales bacterium]